MGDLAAFSLRQEAAISVCEARKDAAVTVIDVANAASAAQVKAVASKPWWRLW